jgi:hypothetical protein
VGTGNPPIEAMVKAAVVEVGTICGLIVDRTADGVEDPV